MNFKKLKEKREELRGNMRKLFETAEKEERAMNEEEVSKFEKYEKEIKSINETIKAEERARELMTQDSGEGDNTHGDDEGNVSKENREKAEERAFANFLRDKVEERADVSMTMTDNGAVIPSSIANKIIENVKEMSPLFAAAEHYNVKGNLTIPHYDEKSGAITMSYATEGVDGDSTSGKFDSIELKGFLARAITDVSKSLINNSSFDIVSFVVRKMSEAIALFLEKELISGTKDKAEGLSKLSNVVTASSSTAVTADELIDLQEAVPDRYQANAFWIMSKATRRYIRKLKDGQGNYLLNKDATAKWGYTLFGKDVYISDAMPEMAEGKRAVLFGDFKGLAVKISEDVNIEILRETKARIHMIEVIGFVEFDAKVQNDEMIAALDMKAAS